MAADAKPATPLKNTMQDPQMRLECLQLAHRPGLAPREVIEMAREYLAWVCGAQGPTTPLGPGHANPAPGATRTSLPTKSAA